jgi:hypothetical protein
MKTTDNFVRVFFEKEEARTMACIDEKKMSRPYYSLASAIKSYVA